MTDIADALDALGFDAEDPRLSPESVRYLPATDERGYVVIVGVVHDHPASVFRVEQLVEQLQPDVVAVELPQLVLPLFRAFAAEGNAAENLGKEMSIALERAGGAEQVGIDAPSVRYTRRLLTHLARREVSWGVRRRVIKDLLLSYVQAFSIVIAALVGVVTGIRLRAQTPIEHGSTRADTPIEQARAEQDHLASRRAFLRAIEVPTTTRVIDTVRERVMAERLAELRRTGDVVAVIGFEHLDPVFERLE